MKIEETLTAKDIREIPELLEKFSAASGALKGAAIRSKDKVVYLVGRGSSGNATLFAKYIWETYAGTITNFIHPHSIFEAVRPLNFKGQAVWAFSQSGKSPDIVACLKKLMGWGALGTAVKRARRRCRCVAHRVRRSARAESERCRVETSGHEDTTVAAQRATRRRGPCPS